MFQEVRQFFAKKNVMEVDVPMLGKAAPIDMHIDVMSISFQGGERGFLHTSPEYAMKRLLSLGAGDIYQMSHVFRDGEIGHLHNPEFTMVEWYRLGISFDTLIEETLEFIQLFLKNAPVSYFSYREAFIQFAGIDYVTASVRDLITCCAKHAVHLPQDAPTWDKDTLLQFIMGFIIEPQLENLTVIRDFPAAQSALAQTTLRKDEPVAERFEVYFKGIELANGFHELTDPIEQRKRLHGQNDSRKEMGKELLPLDENFLKALEIGLPDCCGVAVGFDRLMLLRHEKNHLKEVLPFSWDII
jgi:lysyl-tRNA synthetase class 2